MKNIFLASLALGWLTFAQAAVETYQIDPVHSSISFSVRHIFTKVPGEFTKFSGALTVDRDDLEKTKAEAKIDAASINTRNEKRDTHLRSGDFLVVEKYPTITFSSTTWKKTGDDTFDVTGDLTIRGVTKPVLLKVRSLGFGPGMQGPVCGWEGTTTINRHDFGINLSAGLEKLLSGAVDISLTVEADLKK